MTQLPADRKPSSGEWQDWKMATANFIYAKVRDKYWLKLLIRSILYTFTGLLLYIKYIYICCVCVCTRKYVSVCEIVTSIKSFVMTTWYGNILRITRNLPVTDEFPSQRIMQQYKSLMCPPLLAWTTCWTNSLVSGDLRRDNTHVPVILMAWITHYEKSDARIHQNYDVCCMREILNAVMYDLNVVSIFFWRVVFSIAI